MNTSRLFIRSAAGRCLATPVGRQFSNARPVWYKQETDAVSPDSKDAQKIHSNADEWRESQKSRPLNPQMTNTTSADFNEQGVPKVGRDKAPPELLSSVDSEYTPKDRHPENTERMSGGTQPGDPDKVSRSEYGVGEMEGAEFRIEPLRRTGEDAATMRARLLYQSRKRGTLESDLLLSTFADANLGTMTKSQMEQYDLFLDENDWDIYYWTTQSEANTPTSLEYAEGAIDKGTQSPAASASAQDTDAWRQGKPRSGEWAQTVGTFKPAYRPVPQRWKDSEVLTLLRKHVRERSAGGVLEDVDATPKSKGVGLGRMPDIQPFDQRIAGTHRKSLDQIMARIHPPTPPPAKVRAVSCEE